MMNPKPNEEEKKMIDVSALTTEDVDRLLQLADAFLDQWAEDAVQSGERDPDYEELVDEWQALRPLLVAAPKLLKAAKSVANNCWSYDAAEEYSVANEDIEALCAALSDISDEIG